MKQSLIENMLLGFRTAHDARTAAAQLRQAPGVHLAEYYDADNETPGYLTEYGGLGHGVRLVMIQDDAKTDASRGYHRVQVVALKKARRYAVDMEQTEWEAANRSAADKWHEIAEGLATSLEYHNQFIASLGGDV